MVEPVGDVMVVGFWDESGDPDGPTSALLAEGERLAGALGDELGREPASGAPAVRAVDISGCHALPGCASALAGVVRGNGVRIVLIGSGALAEDLAPRLTASLRGVSALDCHHVSLLSDGSVQLRRPVHGGAVEAAFVIAAETTAVISLDSSRLQSAKHSPSDIRGRGGNTESTSSADDRSDGRIRLQKLEADQCGSDVRVIESVVEASGTSLGSATRIVAGGRGLAGPEGFEAIGRLAAALDAKPAASRPPCDAGWVPGSMQVGITGARVAPELYLAIGISGSAQHLAGMRTSRRIVAVNTDPEAPIFRYADIGVVGDWSEVVSGMLEELGSGQPPVVTSGVGAGGSVGGGVER